MNLTKEQIAVGINAGLAITDPESGSSVPMKHSVNGGVSILRQLLLAIGSGQIALTPTMQQGPKEPAAPSAGKRERKAAARKKKASKK